MGTISHTDVDVSGTNLTTYSFTCTIGVGGGNRRLFFALVALSATTTAVVSSFTVNTVAGTIEGQLTIADGGLGYNIAMLSIATSALADPTVTSVTLAVTYSNAMVRCGVETLVAIDVADARTGAVVTDSDVTGSGTITLDLPIDATAGGIIACGALHQDAGGGAANWTNATEGIESAVEGATRIVDAFVSNASPGAQNISVQLTNISGGANLGIAVAYAAAAVAGKPWYAYAQQRVRTLIHGWRPPLWMPEKLKLIVPPGGLIHA